MFLTFPKGHEPRFQNFQLDGLLDETLREGAERCPFSVPKESKAALARQIVDAGIRDVVFGSGPEDSDLIAEVLASLHNEGRAEGVRFAFILLLNCWEPLFERFKRFPDACKDNVTISFGMVDHRSDERLFETVCERFRSLGFRHFRVSLINNFKDGVEEGLYYHIRSQIDRSVALGIDTVRINDSLGVCYPETMAVLAANLVHDYPGVSFCLHAHDDKGLGLQHALASIYNGFNIIEGAFSGFGNRSGLPAIELLAEIFAEKGITIRDTPLDAKKLRETGYAAEETFLVVPNVYRPVTGQIVNWKNLGVANIPDYLGADRHARKFLNDVGLHEQTVRSILQRAGRTSSGAVPDEVVANFTAYLKTRMSEIYSAKRLAYDDIRAQMKRLYSDHIVFEDLAVEVARADAA